MSTHLRSVVAALLLMGGAVVARADAEGSRLTVEEHDGTYRVRGEFTTPLPASSAWAVLTDYDHIHDYVKSMRSSSMERGSDGGLRLRQEAVAGVFPFRRTIHVELEVREEGNSRILFTDVLHQDFRTYVGEWHVVPGSPRDSARGTDGRSPLVRERAGAEGTTVRYALDAHLRAGVPSLLGRGMMSHSARDLLAQVRAEIMRRGTVPHADAKREALAH